VAIKPDVLYKSLCIDLQSQLDPRLHSLLGTGIMPPTLNSFEYACLSISNSLLKKLSEAKCETADASALNKFIESNLRSMNWELRLNTSQDEELYGGFKSAIYDFFNPDGYELDLSPDAAMRHGGVGPGSGIKANGTDFYTKLFSSPLSCTDLKLYRIYSRMISAFPTWTQAEKARSSEYGEAIICRGNRLCFVPKTTEISRVICVEPTLNMYAQLGMKHILENRLSSKFNINLAKQPTFNRELARLGSNGWGFSTIDLESASDSISTAMLKAILPRNVFRDLSYVRCPITVLPDQSELQLGMFSSMGNAFTFPLQTIIFTCIVCSVYRYLNIPIQKPSGEFHGNFGVFGDDICCVANATQLIYRLLDILGFRVNRNKSFFEGPFRESCGSDYYHGRIVRGVYIRGLEPHRLIASLNQLVEFSANTGVHLPKLCSALRAGLAGKLLPVPRWENDDAGWKVPLSFFKPRVDSNGSFIYKANTPISRQLSILEDRVCSPFGEKKRFFNPDGLHISFINGTVNSMTISVRQSRVRYRRRRRIAPNWNSSKEVLNDTTRFPLRESWAHWKRWESAFYLSL